MASKRGISVSKGVAARSAWLEDLLGSEPPRRRVLKQLGLGAAAVAMPAVVKAAWCDYGDHQNYGNHADHTERSNYGNHSDYADHSNHNDHNDTHDDTAHANSHSDSAHVDYTEGTQFGCGGHGDYQDYGDYLEWCDHTDQAHVDNWTNSPHTNLWCNHGTGWANNTPHSNSGG